MGEEKKLTENVIEKVENKIQELITNEGVKKENVDYLYKLIDIHKDLKNEEYCKVKGEKYMLRGYGEDYGRRYRGEYGRRGVPGTGRGRYRGNDAMMEMQESYDEYNEAYDEAMNGNYGAEGGMVKSAEAIMRSVTEIVEELSEADVPEVKHIIQKYAKKISEMR